MQIITTANLKEKLSNSIKENINKDAQDRILIISNKDNTEVQQYKKGNNKKM